MGFSITSKKIIITYQQESLDLYLGISATVIISKSAAYTFCKCIFGKLAMKNSMMILICAL